MPGKVATSESDGWFRRSRRADLHNLAPLSLSSRGKVVAAAAGTAATNLSDTEEVDTVATAPFPGIAEMTIADLHDAMDTRQLTARELSAMCLERIEALDRNGPSLTSVLEV